MAWSKAIARLCVAAGLAALPPLRAAPPPADRAAWAAVDIIPMPKRIALSDGSMPLKGAVIVIGASASRQDEIGAAWLNAAVTAKGAPQLRVVSENAVPAEAAVLLRVGTRESARAIDAKCAAGEIEIAPELSGLPGYVITWHRDGDRDEAFLCGATPVGALYACVTLAGLLQGQGADTAVRQAEVADWPDFPACTECVHLYHPEIREKVQRVAWGNAPTAAELAAYVAARKEHLDRLLGWKINAFNCREATTRWRRGVADHVPAREAIREVAEYAAARGIRVLIYAVAPFVGRQANFPDAPRRCATLHNGTRWQGTLRCWSMDAERRQTAARLAEYLAACGITDAGFHDTDTGGFYNPAQWEYRCEVCRQRWGDDYAAATLNKFEIYRHEIKARIPQARLHFTFYPYNISVMTQAGAENYLTGRYGPDPGVAARARTLTANFTAFWERLSAGMPADVTFCIREERQENVRAFFGVTAPHGVFTWYKAGSNQWMPFFDETPRFVPTFRSGHDDILYTVAMNTFLPIKALAVREYAWNTGAPGAAPWSRHPLLEQQHHAEPRGLIYEVVLPHVVRAVFGRAAEPEITEALRCNVAPHQIFGDGQRMTPILKTAEMMAWQADEAARGAAALDRLFARFLASEERLGMSMYAQRRFVYLREVLHCCARMAEVKMWNLRARELAGAGTLAAARAAVDAGGRLLAAAQAAMTRLVAERPPDALYNAPPQGNNYNRRWRLYTPVWGVDFEAERRVLAQTEKELPALAAAGQLPETMLAQLRRRPGIPVYRAATAPEIDGSLDESVWAAALPVEAFWRYPEFATPARAHTQARFLRHGEKMYLAATCWIPGGAEVKATCTEPDAPEIFGDDHVELFLWPQAGGSAYYLLAFNALGAVSDRRESFRAVAGGGQVKESDPGWSADGLSVATRRGEGVWTLEAAIPLASVTPSPWSAAWRVNLGRYYAEPTRGHEWSAFMRPDARDFHDTSKFLPLQFTETPAPRPMIELAVAGLKTRTQTLDDRIATLLDFGIAAHASRVLHNVTLVAETLDATGQVQSREEIKRLPRLVYRWDSQDTFTVAFDRVADAGALRLALVCNEARTETIAGFGAWRGAPGADPLFTPRAGAAADDALFGSPALAAPVILPGSVTVAEGATVRILDRRRGTLEFWLRPRWDSPHALETRLPWAPMRTLVHAGVLRREHPWLLNRSCFALRHVAEAEALQIVLRTDDHAGWTHTARLGSAPLRPEAGWRHLACVWDADAPAADQIRLYVDGNRIARGVALSKSERLLGDLSVRLPEQAFAVQLLALNSGRARADAELDELRISRTVRYTDDFEPARAPFETDRHTLALFHFDGDLKGSGISADGAPYQIDAVPGVLERH